MLCNVYAPTVLYVFIELLNPLTWAAFVNLGQRNYSLTYSYVINVTGSSCLGFDWCCAGPGREQSTTRWYHGRVSSPIPASSSIVQPRSTHSTRWRRPDCWGRRWQRCSLLQVCVNLPLTTTTMTAMLVITGVLTLWGRRRWQRCSLLQVCQLTFDDDDGRDACYYRCVNLPLTTTTMTAMLVITGVSTLWRRRRWQWCSLLQVCQLTFDDDNDDSDARYYRCVNPLTTTTMTVMLVITGVLTYLWRRRRWQRCSLLQVC